MFTDDFDFVTTTTTTPGGGGAFLVENLAVVA